MIFFHSPLGSVFDMTQSYDIPFWLAGGFLFVSSGISFMVPAVRRYIKKRDAKRAVASAQ